MFRGVKNRGPAHRRQDLLLPGSHHQYRHQMLVPLMKVYFEDASQCAAHIVSPLALTQGA